MFLRGLSFLCVLLVASSITLNGNRYEDVYIIVQDSVVENVELLSRIQTVFTEASSLLFQATKNHLYFGKIKILVPKSWSKSEYVQKPSFSKLDGYITIGDGLIKIPHVRRKSYKCGEEGTYMYLTPAFLLERNRIEWGKHGHVIVHEWGHLRWGLHDEYFSKADKAQQFYQHESKWKPIRCSEKLEGVIGIGSDCKTILAERFCVTSNTKKRMLDSCNFCPNMEQSVSSSLMGYQYIDTMTMFCDADDESVPEAQRHNKVAPNAQNLFCDYRSAWEVMKDHSDFLSGITPLPDSTNTTPEFEIIQEGVGYRVFVLDVSGSMQGAKIDSQYQTCQYIIQQIIPSGSWLGVVQFSTGSTVLKGMTQVNTQADRDAIMTAIPNTTDASTCIGCGIEAAITMLNTSLNGSAENGEIILLTDGQNNVGDLNLSLEIAKTSQVIIHTIAVEQDADYRLQLIATETGGKHYTYQERGTVSFAAAFSETVSTGLTSAASEAVTLITEKIDTVSSSSLTFQFSIEEGLGRSTSVTVLTGTSNTITISLTGPNNYTDTTNTSGRMLTLQIPGVAQSGEYFATVTANAGQRVEYYIRSSPVSSDVIRVTGRLSKFSFDFSVDTEDYPIIYADVKKSYAPVLNATVFARAETGSITCDIELKDDGQDPDSLLDDGTYSGFLLPSCLSDGRVSIKVNASGNDGETLIFKGLPGSSSPTADDNLTEVVNGSFQRVTTLEELTISNYVNNSADTVAPGRITDLEIHDVKTESTAYGESRNFTLKWTAPGDDKNIGQAVTYEFRISENQTLLMTDFDNAENLTMLNGSIVPQTSGSQEALELVVDAEQSYTDTAFLAIRTVDEAGNTGKVSNIISVTVARGFRASAQRGVIQDIVYDFSDNADEDDSLKDEDSLNIKGIIIGLSTALGIVLIVPALLIYMAKSKKHKRQIEDPVFTSRTSLSTTTTVESLQPPKYYRNSASSAVNLPDVNQGAGPVHFTTSKPDSSVVNLPDVNLGAGRSHFTTSRSFKTTFSKQKQFKEANEDNETSITKCADDDNTDVTLNLEEAFSDFENDDTDPHASVNLFAPPFFMTYKARNDSVFDADDMSVRSTRKLPPPVTRLKASELLKGMPELPFDTKRNIVEHDHPSPNMGPHFLLVKEQGPDTKELHISPSPFREKQEIARPAHAESDDGAEVVMADFKAKSVGEETESVQNRWDAWERSQECYNGTENRMTLSTD